MVADARLEEHEQADHDRLVEMERGLLERYDWLMRQCEPSFTGGEWLLLECAMNDRPPIGAHMPQRLAYLAAEIADHDLDCAMMRGVDLGGPREIHRAEDVDAHAGVDRKALVQRLRAMHVAERFAVVDALERRLASMTLEDRIAASKPGSQ